ALQLQRRILAGRARLLLLPRPERVYRVVPVLNEGSNTRVTGGEGARSATPPPRGEVQHAVAQSIPQVSHSRSADGWQRRRTHADRRCRSGSRAQQQRSLRTKIAEGKGPIGPPRHQVQEGAGAGQEGAR